jgi:hypothetical protein
LTTKLAITHAQPSDFSDDEVFALVDPAAPSGYRTRKGTVGGLKAVLDQRYTRQVDRAINVKDYGAAGDGSADDTAAIQAAISAAVARNGGLILFPSGTYKITSTISVTDPNIVLAGDGMDFLGTIQPFRDGAILVWGGAAGGTMVEFSAVAGASNNCLTSVGLFDLAVNGNSVAGIGVRIMSVWGGKWRFRVHNTTVAGVYCGCVASLGESRTTQANEFIVHIRQSSTDGDGLVLTGDANIGGPIPSAANTSFNLFKWVDIHHKNGVGIRMQDCDTNIFELARTTGVGTGEAVLLEGSNTDDAGVCRGNVFRLLSTNKSIVAKGTTSYTFPSRRNAVNYDIGNGTAAPTVETGASLWAIAGTRNIESDKGLIKPILGRSVSEIDTQRASFGTETVRISNGNGNHVRLVTSTAEWSLVLSSDNLVVNRITGSGFIQLTQDVKIVNRVGFNNASPLSKPTISGSRGGNAALASLLTALASYGLITDSTTA